MKKILALTLTGMLVLGGTGVAYASASATESSPAVQEEVTVTEAYKLYLVPGTYVEGGEKVKNIVSSGATELGDEECEHIFTENAYLCNLEEGATLPVPSSNRLDSEGNAYTFNGWWTIVDATVTYFDKVPELSENTFLYADWRADLSQRMDPVEPDESTVVLPQHYMSIKRAATGDTEIIALRVSGTDVSVDTLLYDRPVQLYNGWFELNPGDVISVYATGLNGATEAQVAPLAVTGRGIELENSGDGSNRTGDYLDYSVPPVSTGRAPSITYKDTLASRHFRIYIKFAANGKTMKVYMEPME